MNFFILKKYPYSPVASIINFISRLFIILAGFAIVCHVYNIASNNVSYIDDSLKGILVFAPLAIITSFLAPCIAKRRLRQLIINDTDFAVQYAIQNPARKETSFKLNPASKKRYEDIWNN